MSTSLDPTLVADLAEQVSRSVLGPQDAGYDSARAVHTDAAPALLRFYRDAVADASDDLTVFAGLVHAPDGSGAKLSALVVCHTGDPADAERDLEPFKTWGSPLIVEVGPMPYLPQASAAGPVGTLVRTGPCLP